MSKELRSVHAMKLYFVSYSLISFNFYLF